MQEVVRQIVANVAENTSAVDSRGSVPTVRKYPVRELVERRGENNEQGRRHDQAVLVHGQVVMDAVEKEVCSDTNTVVRKPPN